MNLKKLRLTVFIAGASVMIVEILGSRLIAPYHGSSTYVWSALIGVILASLTLGYHFGGRLADQNPSEKSLSRIFLYSAILVLIIPVFGDTILLFTMLLGVKLGSFMGALLLLAAPSFCLGMVTPYAIKLSVEKLDNIGSTSGDLYALSTIGSILGTFATGFVLIPYVGVAKIFFGVSLLLLASGIILNSSELRLQKHSLLALIALLTLFFTPQYYTSGRIIHVEDTPYSRILVDEDNSSRYMHLDGTTEGAINLSTGYTSYEYINYFELPFLMNPQIKEVLVAGEGTGVGPRQIAENHPDVGITVAEINPRVHEVAKEYFMFNETDKVKVRLEDVRVVVKTEQQKYDYVILDAFNGVYSIPYYLLTKEFFSELSGKMNARGILLVNTISAVEGPKSVLMQSIIKTLSEKFKFIQVYHLGSDAKAVQNVIIIASNTPLPEKQKLVESATDTKIISKEHIIRMIDSRLEQPPYVGDGITLTDDYSPADHLCLSLLT